MTRSPRFAAILLAVCLAVLACSLPANPERIQRYLSGTQTAEADIPTIPTTPAEDSAELPEPPAPAARCELFADLDLPIYLLDVYASSPSLVIYVEFPAGVVGLEDGRQDGAPWEYSATLGEVESLWCAVFEGEEHAGRLYCMFPLPKEYHNAAKPLSVQVNLCDAPIVSIPRQSVIVAEAPALGAGSGSTGGAEGGAGIEGILGIFGIFTSVCGEEPYAHARGDNSYEAWCTCMGGDYAWEVWYNMAGIEDGIMQSCSFP